MKKLLKDLIPQRALRLVEEREYNLRQLSPGAYDVLGSDVLGIPMSAIVDVKILKAPKPIFKCFLENGQSFNLIDNGEYMQADINRILFDMDREDDTNGAKYELEKLMKKGSFKPEGDEEASDEFGDEPTEEPAAEEPAEEPEV
jgi:hypothetical protein|tara:strand:+ start:197 stop:628 length:432 start_codon:yes stop_codon:yes gene_type:complete